MRFLDSFSNIKYILFFSIYHTSKIRTAIQQTGFRRVKRGYRPLNTANFISSSNRKLTRKQTGQEPSDPYFKYQWYLKNTGQNGGKPRLDLNVKAAWAQGVTGKNVTTAIMDDGEFH